LCCFTRLEKRKPAPYGKPFPPLSFVSCLLSEDALIITNLALF
jgi:hypothetical protein